MYKINETKLAEITSNIESLRANFGKWVELYIETDTEVIVTSNKENFLRTNKETQILGKLSLENSKSISNKIYSGKKVKARICDFYPPFVTKIGKDPQVTLSIWQN